MHHDIVTIQQEITQMWILVEVDSPHDVGRNEKRRIIINGSEVHPATLPAPDCYSCVANSNK